MSDNLGRVITAGHAVTNTSGIDLQLNDGPYGRPRFVLLHFDNVNLTGGAKLTVDLGYFQDVCTAAAGSTLWIRSCHPTKQP
jgi:hypothetical protein